MSTNRNELVSQFTDLLASLDPVTTIVERLKRSLQAWDVESSEEAGIHKQAIMDEIGRLGRVVTELQVHGSGLRLQRVGELDDFSQAEENAAAIWRLISNGKEVWETLGQQIAAMITTHLLSINQPDILAIKNGVYDRLKEEFGSDNDAELAYNAILDVDGDSRFRRAYFPQDKPLLQLKYMLDLSQGRIANLMGVTQPAIQTRLARAFTRLVQQVGLRKLVYLAQHLGLQTELPNARRRASTEMFDFFVFLAPNMVVGIHVVEVPTTPGEEPDQTFWDDTRKRIYHLQNIYRDRYRDSVETSYTGPMVRELEDVSVAGGRLPIPVVAFYRRKTSEIVLFPTINVANRSHYDSVYQFDDRGLSDLDDWGRSWELTFLGCPRNFEELHTLILNG